MPRGAVTLKFPSPLGDLDAQAEIYGPIADRLDGRIVPFDEIATLPALMSVGLSGTLQALALMVHAGQVLPLVQAPGSDLGPGQRYNRAIAAHAERGRFYNFIAAPVARAGLPASSTELMLLSGILAGHEQNPAALAEHVAMLLRRNGVSLQREGETVTDPAVLKEILDKAVQEFLTGKLPLWRHLGAL